MAQNINYNLAWAPTPGNENFNAPYTLNFNAYADNVFYLQGSYNMHEIHAKTIYINNKANNNNVTLNAANGQYVRQVPPFSEAYLPIESYQSVTISASGGSTTIEINNTASEEKIFQRTDSGIQLISASTAVGCVNNDLVTIDRAGRFKPCTATTVGGNNSTTDLSTDTAWPARPTGIGANTTYFGLRNNQAIGSNGNFLEFSNAGTGTSVFWEANSRGVNRSVAVANPASSSACYFCETQNYYYMKNDSDNLISQVSKSSFAVVQNYFTPLAFGGVSFGQSAVPVSAGLNTDNFYIAGLDDSVNSNLKLYKMVGGSIASASSIIPINAGSFIGNAPKSVKRINGDLFLISGSGGGALSIVTCREDGTVISPYTNIAISLLNGNNQANGQACYEPIITTGGAFTPYCSSNNVNGFVYCDNSGNLTNTILDSNALVRRLDSFLTRDNCCVFAWGSSISGGSVQLRKYNSSGTLIASKSFTEPAMSTGGFGIYNFYPFLLFMYVGSTTPLAIIFDLNLNIVCSGLTIVSGANTHSRIWDDVTGFYYAQAASTTVTALKSQLAQSIFGVYKDGGSVAITGYFNINQNYPGSTSFNQNAATVIGNRGLIINNVVQLSGLS